MYQNYEFFRRFIHLSIFSLNVGSLLSSLFAVMCGSFLRQNVYFLCKSVVCSNAEINYSYIHFTDTKMETQKRHCFDMFTSGLRKTMVQKLDKSYLLFFVDVLVVVSQKFSSLPNRSRRDQRQIFCKLSDCCFIFLFFIFWKKHTERRKAKEKRTCVQIPCPLILFW